MKPTLALLLLLSLIACRTTAAGKLSDPSPAGHHASVNGLRMYYEIHGAGRPLVLLHGAYSNIETDFARLIPSLAQHYQVIAIEQQGHGRTGDIDRPLSYEQMADDSAALLEQLHVEQADFFGYSMGGGVALMVARRHPALVRKLVFAGGAAYAPSGYYPELLSGFDQITPELMAGTPWGQAYQRLSPRPQEWPGLVAKLKALDVGWKGWPADEIKAIAAPSLLIIGDADIVRPEHTVELFRLLGGGVAGDLHGLPASQLAVLPGTTHVTLVERSDWLLSMIPAFLEAPVPATAR